ncbi:toll/interleukin-1 receptor domain-containing protein [Cupriavidus pinatubonensis]|uniref:TIR domain-containing protein n=1 Tax=Cupriavidus pinatubonensis TaxID=248026 RepID=A0ABN7ZD35_9BURK|nr:toll/interleukin-1 receptor domain-containing protein [Cupriavidus pinatubonensis]CAG9183879.1 hypothetical protein LMG23994_05253 [Cupriavidus pinatubonensis]
MTATKSNDLYRKCFISAPIGLDLSVLQRALKARNVKVLVPQGLKVGSDWVEEVRAQITQSSLAIGVLSENDHSPWVFFELGIASALGCRILLISPPGTDPIPLSSQHVLVLRVAPDNEEAIGFALDQILSAPDRKTTDMSPQRRPSLGLGEKVDPLLRALDRSLAENNWKGVEDVVFEALNSTGADVVVTSPTRDKGADFAVWSDVLESLVGNPLLIEVKSRIVRREDAARMTQKLARYVSASSAHWGMLLYGEGPNPDSDWWSKTSPNILVLPLRNFLESLRSRTFPELIRDLRNRRVHGMSI